MGESTNSLPGYELLEQVGVGGMSTVWKARDVETSEIVAIKILKEEFSKSGNDLQQFKDEANAMRNISHVGIVKSEKFVEHQGKAFFVMEFVDGYNFGQLLARKQHLNEDDCLLICESVSAALDFAWNEHGIVHCDIKPENIMINSQGIVKITDLGLCHTFKRAIKLDNTPVSKHVYGTPAYISPEQVYGDVQPDCRADIYSLAATIYHLATGRVLFPNLDAEASMLAHCDEKKQAKDPRIYRPALSKGFCQLLEAMLVKERDYRLASWEQVYNMSIDIENGQVFTNRASSSPSSLAFSS